MSRTLDDVCALSSGSAWGRFVNKVSEGRGRCGRASISPREREVG